MACCHESDQEILSCPTSPRERTSSSRSIRRGRCAAQNQAAHGEWTAPTTPIALLYKEWPGHRFVGPEDVVFVGTIGDLHAWMQRDESDFDFLIRTILFGTLSACVAVFLALPDKKAGLDRAPRLATTATNAVSTSANVEPGTIDRKEEPASAP